MQRRGKLKTQLITPRSPLGSGSAIGTESAFTLLEVIIVISLIAMVYAIAFPNMNIQREAQISDRLGRLSEDIRAVFDVTVLTRRPHRLVFHLAAGEYYVERSESGEVLLATQPRHDDLALKSDDELRAEFDELFVEYEDLVGEPVKNPEDDTTIPQVTPVLKAKERLRPPKWGPADGLGWHKRSLGDFLIIRDIQTEHLERPVSLEEDGEEAKVVVYFMPRGYVERTQMHIYQRKNSNEIDNEQLPYTVVIDPQLGSATVTSGYEEINVHTGQE